MHLQTLAITINQSLIGKVRLLLTMLHHIPRPFGLGIFCCHSSARNSKPGISLYRGCSFLGGCGILGLAQQIEIYKIGDIDIIMWNELGISGGTAIVILIALYYVIKWAVKNGIKEAYRAITGEKTNEDIQNEKELKELGLDSDDK